MKRVKVVWFIPMAILVIASVGWGQWKPHSVRQLNGRSEQINLPTKFQIVTENWNRVVAVPHIVYMPEKDRVLMLVSCDYPHEAMIIWSDDHGTTWTKPRYVHTDAAGKPDTGMGTGLTYLGNGIALLVAGNAKGTWTWFSSDYGETWSDRAPFPPASNRLTFNFGWDPPLIDKDPKTGKVERVVAGGYTLDRALYEGTAMPGYSVGGIRFSTGVARTWGDVINVPEWYGVNEVAFVRAKNGDIVAACRTDWPKRFRKDNFDHYEGLGISISKDNGKTWSRVNKLYDWGRHHPCMVVLPNADIVTTYVVRKGYPVADDGYPQFGIEAVVSHDNGHTWDSDHRYILTTWKGIRTGPNAWYASSQATSTVLLPEGSLLTAFGTGYRSLDPAGKGKPGPRDVGLVRWNLNTGPVNSGRRIASAPFDSDLRNKFDPGPGGPTKGKTAPGNVIQNIATVESGPMVSASGSDLDPKLVLNDPYVRNLVTLETIPGWIEIAWPKEHRIDEIHILPGAPQWAGRPTTECVPLDYRLQYLKGSEWVDLIPPVTNAKRYAEFYGNTKAYLIQDEEFEYIHKFTPAAVKAIRMHITRSSDTGKRIGSGKDVVVPEGKRQTVLRGIEVFKAKAK
ncbi:MAG: exo-alpha-sialidase [Acidobacteria bacterium]|nr:exo-alpha-sialidase [Acidobacteriota bacterium]